MSRALIVDGFDMFELGFVLDSVDGHRGMAFRRLPTTDVPGTFGPVVVSSIENYAPRALNLTGTVEAVSFAVLRARLDEIKYRVAGADRIVTLSDDETRQYRKVRFEELVASPIPPALFQPYTRVALRAVARDPRGYSTGVTVSAGFGSTDTAMPLGTAPVGPVVRVSGAAVNPAVIYKNNAGTEQARVTFASTISSTDYYDVDLDRLTVIDKAGANVSDKLNSTATTFFSLDPSDGDYVTSAWPTLQVTAGSAVATYRKGYW